VTRTTRRTRARLAILALLGAAAPGGAQPAPAERRLVELTALVAADDRGAAAAYVDSAYDRGTLRREGGWYVDQLSHLRRATQGLRLDAIRSTSPFAVTARYRAAVSDVPVSLTVRVDSLPPHRVSAFRATTEYRRPADPPARWLTHAQMAREVERTAGRLAAADLFAGVVLLARGDRVLLARAYGPASRERGVPNTLGTRFRIGSMTKMFTAVAIAQLAERGRISLDDPVARWVPGVLDSADARAIRIRHLLTHTSGLGDYLTPRLRQRAPRLRTVDDRLAAIRADSAPTFFEPGTAWMYSNVGYVLLGKVVEAASGEDYDGYVRRHVFAPAGMRRSAFVDLDVVAPGVATGYDAEATDGGWVFRRALDAPGTRSGPDGNSVTTATDMLRFARALQEHRLLAPASTRLVLTPKPELGAPAWGYGFAVDTLRRMVGHGGGAPGVETEFDIFPETGYTVVVLSNYGASARPVWQALWDVVAASPEARRLAARDVAHGGR
jgi:CubicO group peptidase (beta-lactamase class C family)